MTDIVSNLPREFAKRSGSALLPAVMLASADWFLNQVAGPLETMSGGDLLGRDVVPVLCTLGMVLSYPLLIASLLTLLAPALFRSDDAVRGWDARVQLTSMLAVGPAGILMAWPMVWIIAIAMGA